MVDIQDFAKVELKARERLEKMRGDINYSLARIAEGNPLAAERSSRRVDRIQAKTALSRPEAEMISVAIDAAAEGVIPKAPEAVPGVSPVTLKTPGPEAIRGATLDFVGVAFFELGRRAADAVGRVAFLNGAPQGTGFLVAPRLFLTNHHVISSAADARRFQVQFDYEYDRSGLARAASEFFFDPEYCFVTDDVDGLDFTMIGIGERRSGSRTLEDFGFLTLSDAGDKHMLGEIANVIQHPDGRFKELVLRENHLVARDETSEVLHYVADTEQGSSGSPVFNNEWEPIALHHWGGPWREVMGTGGQPLSREINEGIRISAIVRALKASDEAVGSAALRQALDLWDEAKEQRRGGAVSTPTVMDREEAAKPVRPAEPGIGASGRLNADGSVTWVFPLEISVRAPLLAAPAAAIPVQDKKPDGKPQKGAAGTAEASTWKTENFDDRGGYEPGFVPGFFVPLPKHDGAKWRAAMNQLAKPGDDPFELRYHHFSVVMNAERRLCYFTACNIDGSRIKAVNREDKVVVDNPTLGELGVESIGAEGAEASDDFRPDRRILPEEQMNRPFYEKQIVAGFLDTKSPERTARIFQKGHIVLRGDPAWGTEDEAKSGERDTFFYTNAAPQVGFFNQGSELNRPGSKGKLRWRAVETYVLRNAVTMRQRISVFAGPIFDDETDPPYRFESQVPMRFWKIAVWSDGSDLRSIALLADQKPVLKIMPEAIGPGAEAFADEEELARVSEFLSTVAEIEGLTGLDFGDAVRAADIRAGIKAAKPPSALTLEPEDLARPRRRAAKAASVKRATKRTTKARKPARTKR